jgi:hypothetical protein
MGFGAATSRRCFIITKAIQPQHRTASMTYLERGTAEKRGVSDRSKGAVIGLINLT